ncbi:MAG: ROK family protein, partial [Pseudomonadota bacterium]
MRLGLDFGGTKIEGLILDDEGVERARTRVATPRHDYAGSLEAIAGLVAELERLAGSAASRIGIGVPGSVDRASGTVSLGNSTWLHGQGLRDDLAARLARPI